MFLVHDRFMDVFVEVLSEVNTPVHRELLVKWWNMGYTGNPWQIPVKTATKRRPAKMTQWIKIKQEDISSWKEFDPNRPSNHPGRQ